MDVEDFCRAAWPRLVRGLAVWCSGPAEAEELAQETLLRVWSQWGRLTHVTDVDAWMWRVAINLSRSAHRRAVAEKKALRRLGGLRVVVPEPTIADAALLEAVRALPERQRRAVVLRHVVDLPVGTVATAMGCAEGTVRALTHQGLEQLRRTQVPATHPEEVAHDG